MHLRDENEEESYSEGEKDWNKHILRNIATRHLCQLSTWIRFCYLIVWKTYALEH